MKAKLIKTLKDSHHSGHYFLNNSEGFAIGSTDKNWCKRVVNKNPLYVLSLKNCQAIANGYDLDELVDKVITTDFENELYVVKKISKIVAKEVAKAILEILGDKKFSKEDMLKSFITGVFTDEASDHDFEFTELMKDLQKTEWEVEILEVENDEVYSVSENMKVAHNKAFDGVLFKHDADGCLILKRK